MSRPELHEMGRDDEGIRHLCFDDEIDLHTLSTTCGCNPDCLNTEGYTPVEDPDFWSHHRLKP